MTELRERTVARRMGSHPGGAEAEEESCPGGRLLSDRDGGDAGPEGVKDQGPKAPVGPTFPEVWWLRGHGEWAASGRSLEGQQHPLE